MNQPPAPNRFGELLRAHRLRRGFSQAYLAERAGISVEAVGTLERGTRRAPYGSTITLLVAALELGNEESLEFEAAASQARARVQSLAGQRSSSNLPAQFSSFVGRDKDVFEIGRLVADHRLVSVTGAGGIGKTRIAVQVAENLLHEFESASFADFAPVTNVDFIPITLLSVLNVPESPNRKSLDTLIGHLKNKHALLIFDNCEHLVDGAAAAAGMILQHCPLVHIIATSREVLGVDGERVVRVPTLTVPQPETVKSLTVDQALEYGAVALFVDRATDADSRFEFTETSVPAIVEICRRLDGIALAIEIAAARINILSPKALAGKLNERFLILTGARRTCPPRHRTIRELLDWSYDLLDDREQRVLRKLSVFVGGFTLELATMLCAQDDPADESEIVNVLGSLADKSLVQYEWRFDTARYQLLESTRQYANEKLHKRNESCRAARAHARAIAALVEGFMPLHIVSDHVWNTQAQAEIENWRAALRWAFGPRGDVRIGQQLASAINPGAWFSQGAAEGLHWVCRAIETCDDTAPPAVRAKLELAQAMMLLPLGRSQTVAALAAAERALQLYEEAGDPLGAAAALSSIGEGLAHKNCIPEAEHALRAALAAAQRAGARRIVAHTTHSLATVRAIDGDLDAARHLNRETIEMYKTAGCRRKQVIQELFLAELEFQAGNSETALQLSLESVRSFREYNAALYLATGLSNAGAYSIALARFDEARTYLHEAILLASDADFGKEFAWASQHLAAIAALRPHDHTAGCLSDLRRAARAVGFVDALLAELDSPRTYTEQQEYEKILGLLRPALGAEFEELMAEGTHWSTERALAELLTV